jgi:hypothetical protein
VRKRRRCAAATDYLAARLESIRLECVALHMLTAWSG